MPGSRPASPLRLTGWRRWAVPLIVVTVVPLLLLGLLELGLRVAGYGEPAAFFVPVAGRPGEVTTSRSFGWRFFPRPVAREPVVLEMARAKPEGTYRVFVLGGSAALGTPDHAFGLARVLEVMLAEAYPERRFEVVNAAMAAVSSHVVREIARECARYEPDLFVVYMGNNEVVGPYGPGSVFGRFTPGLTTTRAAIRARATRLGQLLQAPSRWLGAEEVDDWTGLEMFAGREVPADDPRLAATYDHFRRNLEDVIAAGGRAGARVLVSTVAVNLLDSPPFGGGVGDGGGGGGGDGGGDGGGEGSAALAAYREGRSAASPGTIDLAAAAAALRLARDLDPLRFRADGEINRIVRQVAAETAAASPAPGVALVDGEAAISSAARLPGLPGDDLFWEHVHLRFEGNHLLARAIFDELRPWLASGAEDAPRVLTAAEAAEALGLTAWDRYRMAETIVRMTDRPPFTRQFDHPARQELRRHRLAALRLAWRRESAASESAKRRAADRRPDDLVLRQGLAGLLHDRGDPAAAAAEWCSLVERLPDVPAWRTSLGFALADAGRLPEAEDELRRALELSGGSAAARVNLADVLERRDQPAAAEAEYRAALRQAPRSEPARLALAGLNERQGDVEAALEQYRLALEARPGSAPAHRRLAETLDRLGRLDEAAASYRASLAADPYQAAVHNNLGYALERLGRLDEAIQQYQVAVVTDPGYALARFNLGDALLTSGRLEDAAATYRAGLALDPSNAQARRNLARATGVSVD